jgi:hypothetical protein
MRYKNRLTTEEKALKINLTPEIYGCFAEIGAGQEVAGNFFKAGASSGTIAYTQSAYDMKVSDSMYGPTNRYVCEERLNMMLFTEFETMRYRLPEKAKETKFFAFCNTVQSLNYHKSNQGHGWVGLRFQLNKESEPNDIVLHVKMHDNTNRGQQAALGILGVNLIHAAFFHHDNVDDFFSALTDRLPPEKIEIDMLRVTGPNFERVDNRFIALNLVKKDLTHATMFDMCGNVMQPSETLYKKKILLIRGRFRPVTKVHLDMIENAKKQFLKEKNVKEEDVVIIFELTIRGLTSDGVISDRDFVERTNLLGSLGYTVMISNYIHHTDMVKYISTISRGEIIGLVLNVNNIHTIFDESYYKDVSGGIMEALGRGFGQKVKMYVYPALDNETGQLHKFEDLTVAPHLSGLLDYFKMNNKIEAIEDFNYDLLHIYPGEVLQKIISGDESWKSDVPDRVAKAITFLQIFGYQRKSKIEETTN